MVSQVIPIITAVLLLTANAQTHSGDYGSTLRAQLQELVTQHANVTGMPMQLAFVSSDIDLAIAADPWGASEGRPPLTPESRLLYGSAVKTFVGTRIMQLVDLGVLSLNDSVSKWADPVLKVMNDTSIAELFGPQASAVTVGMLVRMASGLADYDTPAVDDLVLDEANVTSPVDILLHFSGRKQFMCEPGTCVAYSSTNFVLAGFVLLGASGPTIAELKNLGAEAWTALRLDAVLDYAPPDRFRRTRFLAHGAMNPDQGLDIPGFSGLRGGTRRQVFHQDGSILGWTCGNLLTTAREEARFLWDLLGDPASPVVSPASRAAMIKTRPVSTGWANGSDSNYHLEYGTGLMWQTVTRGGEPKHYPMPAAERMGAHLGHGGLTYGFFSNSGFFPLINASMSAALSQPNTSIGVNLQTDSLLCEALRIAATLLHPDIDTSMLACPPPKQAYICQAGGPNQTASTGRCVPDPRGSYACALPNTTATCALPGPQTAISRSVGGREEQPQSIALAAHRAAVPSLAAAQSAPIVHAPAGTVQGVAQGEFHAFLGVPFAEQPVGDLRWRPPQPLERWPGTLQAVSLAPPCISSRRGWPSEQNTGNWSEACLFLNIVTPAKRPTPAFPHGYPVVVYFHAGEYVAGTPVDSESDTPFGPDVILVMPASRLGPFGFLASEDLRSRTPNNGTGNYGMLDQRAALHWVRDNIQAFGGDPGCVTIMGESSGGASVANHLTSSASWGLFHRAILESPGLTQVKRLDDAEENYAYLIAALLGAGSAGCERLPGAYSAFSNTLLEASPIAGAGGSEADGWNLARAQAACDALRECHGISAVRDSTSLSGTVYTLHNSTAIVAHGIDPYGSKYSNTAKQLTPTRASTDNGSSIVSVTYLKAPRTGHAGVACLLQAEPLVLLPLSEHVPHGDSLLTDLFAPVVDGVELHQDYLSAFDAGHVAPGVPVLIGGNMDEGTMFIGATPHIACNATAGDFDAWLSEMFGNTGGAALDPLYQQLRQPVPDCPGALVNSTSTPCYHTAATRVLGDFTITCPVREVGVALSRVHGHGHGQDVFSYYFVHTPLTSINMVNLPLYGAFHGAEIPFVFHDSFELNSTEERALSRTMSCYWRNFVHSGDPNKPPMTGTPCAGGPPPPWPRYNAQRTQQVLDVESGGGVRQLPEDMLRAQRCGLLSALLRGRNVSTSVSE